jgi:hypothetical protein
MYGQRNNKYTEMHGQQNNKYTEMHGQQNNKYTEMHGQQNLQIRRICYHSCRCPVLAIQLPILWVLNLNLIIPKFTTKRI